MSRLANRAGRDWMMWELRGLLVGLSVLLAGVQAGKPAYTPIDFQNVAEQGRTWNLGFEGDSLEALAPGEKKMEGVPFAIGEKILLVSGRSNSNRKPEINSVPIGKMVRQLHLLQGMQNYAPKGTLVGYYKVHYKDEMFEVIPIVAGLDINDWWQPEGSDANLPRSKTGWEGSNAPAKAAKCKIVLYHSIWINPYPENEIKYLSFCSTHYTDASPFCVAVTVEH